jgi:single-stranded DNA-binding protein
MENNKLVLVGNVRECVLSFTSRSKIEEKFYRIELEIPRKSKYVDVIPVVCSEKLLYDVNVEKGSRIRVEGKIHTRNYEGTDGRSHLNVFAYARDVSEVPSDEKIDNSETNYIELHGYVCRDTHSRRTGKTKRAITDIMLAVNRVFYDKTDYIPCIAWGRNATLAGKRKVGDLVKVVGRFQSRQYDKKGIRGTKTAYEISVMDMSVIDNIDETKEEAVAEPVS